MVTMRKDKFVPEQYYHIYSRVLFNAPEFSDHWNANKLCQNFVLANSTKSTEAFLFLNNNKKNGYHEAVKIAQQGERLVNILCYSIMPDHYHLLLQEKIDGGIINFISKCNVSIAKYINTKNKRRGPLFESRFQSKHVDSNKYLLHLSVYINLNPLDFLVNKDWRQHKLKNWKQARNKLLNYPWSSVKDFLKGNYDNSILSGTKIVTKQFKNQEDYENFLREWSIDDSFGNEFE